MDIYNLNLSSSDDEPTASDCESDNGRSNVIVETIYNHVESQKQSETLLKFKQDNLMGHKDMVIQVVEFLSGG